MTDPPTSNARSLRQHIPPKAAWFASYINILSDRITPQIRACARAYIMYYTPMAVAQLAQRAPTDSSVKWSGPWPSAVRRVDPPHCIGCTQTHCYVTSRRWAKHMCVCVLREQRGLCCHADWISCMYSAMNLVPRVSSRCVLLLSSFECRMEN